MPARHHITCLSASIRTTNLNVNVHLHMRKHLPAPSRLSFCTLTFNPARLQRNLVHTQLAASALSQASNMLVNAIREHRLNSEIKSRPGHSTSAPTPPAVEAVTSTKRQAAGASTPEPSKRRKKSEKRQRTTQADRTARSNCTTSHLRLDESFTS